MTSLYISAIHDISVPLHYWLCIFDSAMLLISFVPYIGFPVEERDFSDEPITVTFEPNDLINDQQQLSIFVPNEEVNEAVEFFFVVLELVGGENRVILEQQSISLCRIVDTDSKQVANSVKVT